MRLMASAAGVRQRALATSAQGVKAKHATLWAVSVRPSPSPALTDVVLRVRRSDARGEEAHRGRPRAVEGGGLHVLVIRGADRGGGLRGAHDVSGTHTKPPKLATVAGVNEQPKGKKTHLDLLTRLRHGEHIEEAREGGVRRRTVPRRRRGRSHEGSRDDLEHLRGARRRGGGVRNRGRAPHA